MAKPPLAASETALAEPGERAAAARRPKASGTTTRLKHGAATIPSAIADWPEAMPSATASANAARDADSQISSAASSPNRRLPARKPRA